jgi:DNA topoisomerase IB
MIRLVWIGKTWIRLDNKPISDRISKVLEKYKIPTYLTDVELYVTSIVDADRSLVFSGLDTKGKRQYFYGVEYVKIRRQKKLVTFLHVHNYYETIVKDIEHNLSSNKPLTQIYTLYLALLFSTQTYIRTGLMKSLETYGTIGLLTLNMTNINILSADKVSISFVGKDQVHHTFEIKSKYAVEQAKSIKLQDQFYFCYWEDDQLCKLTENELYKFMKDRYDGIRIKDIRTYGANIIFINLISMCIESTPKKTISKAIDETAKTIGHTKSICKKAYLVDEIIEYVSNNLDVFINQKDRLKFIAGIMSLL